MTLARSDRQISDPEDLPHLHRLFQSCWQEVAAKLSLDSESESSLRRTIASRILREAGQGETDDQELRRKALFGILDRPNAPSPTASSRRLENGT
jgi:hypothetical protein